MSLTIISHKPESRVTVGGEHDKDGRRGFVLLACSPSPCCDFQKSSVRRP